MSPQEDGVQQIPTMEVGWGGAWGGGSHSKSRLKDHLKIRTSTSGTISSESSPAITCERPIGVDTISVITTGVRNKALVDV